MLDKEKVFFCPGDLLTLKHDIPNKPKIMYMVKKETRLVKSESANGSTFTDEYFEGIRCRWFSLDQKLQEAIFNTKDLIKL